MKRRWLVGLTLLLGGLAARALAGEAPWQPAPAKPVAIQVSLGRPQAIETDGDRAVTRVSYHHAVVPVARKQGPEPLVADGFRARPMPVGPPDSGFAAGAGASAPTPLSSGFAAESEVVPPLGGRRVVASSAPVTSTSAGQCGDACRGMSCGDCCGVSCGACCDPCAKPWCGLCTNCCALDPHCLYFSAEYLLWWIKDGRTPPLATTGPFTGDPLTSSGIIGQPGTIVLFDDLDYDVFSGGRFTIGWWPDPCCQSFGLEVSGFFLGERSVNFFADSVAYPVLARPFFNPNGFPPTIDPGEFSEITARPDLGTGSLAIHAPSRLWGIEANARCNKCCGCNYRWDLLGGVRYLDLDESITIVERITVTADDTTFPAGTRIIVSDQFATRNQFIGGQIGLAGQYKVERWSLDLRAKIAIGVTHQTVDISGGQLVIQPDGSVQQFTGGLLALPGNIGHFSRDKFTVVPELGFNIGYDLGPNCRIFAGYTFLYWSSVLRPGDQIDRVLNVNRIPNFPQSANPGPNRPVVPLKGTDFWAHGVNFGLEYRY